MNILSVGGFVCRLVEADLSVGAGFKPAHFYDGTDFAYIGGDILCLFDCSFFKYLFNIDIDFYISEFFAGI